MRTLAISFCVAAFLHASSNAGAKCPRQIKHHLVVSRLGNVIGRKI